jgi:hypothetical protein
MIIRWFVGPDKDFYSVLGEKTCKQWPWSDFPDDMYKTRECFGKEREDENQNLVS